MSLALAPFIAIVPAAGIGARMRAAVPKQYLHIDDKTVLEHTIERLAQCSRIERIVVVLHPEDRWFEHLNVESAAKITTVVGGDERADSVLAALNVIDDSAWAVVHDAARPCLSQADLDRLLDACQSDTGKGAILAVPVRDTMKRASEDANTYMSIQTTVSRDRLWHALTPQCFNVRELRNAILTARKQGILVTDEASAMEAAGHTVLLIEGSPKNLKITYPDDLLLADFYLQLALQKGIPL